MSDGGVINPLVDPNVLGGLVRVGWCQIELTPDGGLSPPGPLLAQIDDIECNALCYSGRNGSGCKNDLGAAGLASCTPKGWSLAVLAGPSAPRWLFAGAGNLGAQTFDEYGLALLPAPGANACQAPARLADGGAGPVQMALFWDPVVQARLGTLAGELAALFGNDPYLRLVYVPQMTDNGVEGQFNAIPPPYTALEAPAADGGAGLTIDKWVGALEAAAGGFALAFSPGNPETAIASAKPIGIELHYLLGSSCEGLRVMTDLLDGAADAGFGALAMPALSQIGVADWWLNGDSSATSYQGDLIYGVSHGDVHDAIDPSSPSDPYGLACAGHAAAAQLGGFQAFTQAGGRVFAQVKADSADAAAFPPPDAGGYAAIFTQAPQVGIRYLEVWQQDLAPASTAWESDFAAFDADAGPAP